MRIFWGVLCWMAAASIAFAQAQRPEATVFDDALSIPNGYTEILRFGPAIETVKVVTKGVIAVNALTDHSIAITGEGLGATILFVYGPDGRQIYGARVEVASEPGHRVNVHTKPSTHEYHAYYCTH